MRRRDFIKGIAGSATWSLAARAQQPEKIRRIGVLMGFVEHDPEGQAQADAFVQGLGVLNWKEGSNLRIDWRWGDSDRALMERYAAELVAFSPDLLLAGSSSIANEGLLVFAPRTPSESTYEETTLSSSVGSATANENPTHVYRPRLSWFLFVGGSSPIFSSQRFVPDPKFSISRNGATGV